MKVDVDVGTLEESMLVPLGFADAQHVTCGFHCRHISGFICGVSYRERHINDRFRGEPWNRRGPNVLELKDPFPKSHANPFRFPAKKRRPFGTIFEQQNGSVMQPKPTDPCGLHFLFSSHYPSLREFDLARYSMIDPGGIATFHPKARGRTSVRVPLISTPISVVLLGIPGNPRTGG